jgi:hypothetical protein
MGFIPQSLHYSHLISAPYLLTNKDNALTRMSLTNRKGIPVEFKYDRQTK